MLTEHPFVTVITTEKYPEGTPRWVVMSQKVCWMREPHERSCSHLPAQDAVADRGHLVTVAAGSPGCGWVGSLARPPWSSSMAGIAHWLFRMPRAWSERQVEAEVGISSLPSPPTWRAQGESESQLGRGASRLNPNSPWRHGGHGPELGKWYCPLFSPFLEIRLTAPQARPQQHTARGGPGSAPCTHTSRPLFSHT